MKEKKSRKEWVKNFAIIFLSVLLVLTFFSNTIRNYSLPEVAAQYTNSGSITNKVRGQGTVSSTDPYSVVYKQSRKVDSVSVHVGDEVEKGDVLFVLEEGESDELKKAMEELEGLKTAYQKAVITGQISSNITTAVQSGTTESLESSQKKMQDLKSKIEAHEKEASWIDNQITLWTTGSASELTERKSLQDAQANVNAWTTQKNITSGNLATAEIALNAARETYYQTVDASGNDISGNDPQKEAFLEAQRKFNECKTADDTANTQLANSQSWLNQAQKTIDDKVAELKRQKEISEKSLEEAKKALTDLTTDLTTQLDLETTLASIEAKQAEVDKLKSEQGSNEITAPVSGTVLSLNRVAGETIENGETVATIQVAGKGYTMSMTVTNEQAMLISVGDEAEVTNSWYYSEVHARIISIRPDPAAPSTSKKVTFEVEGDVTNGQNLSVVVGKKTANYDNIVPNSAIKEDSKGKFVYRVNSKPTPLGTRYTVERIDVKVLAEDETQSAISAALEGWDYLVTTSSKPLTDGQLVRLKD